MMVYFKQLTFHNTVLLDCSLWCACMAAHAVSVMFCVFRYTILKPLEVTAFSFVVMGVMFTTLQLQQVVNCWQKMIWWTLLPGIYNVSYEHFCQEYTMWEYCYSLIGYDVNYVCYMCVSLSLCRHFWVQLLEHTTFLYRVLQKLLPNLSIRPCPLVGVPPPQGDMAWYSG